MALFPQGPFHEVVSRRSQMVAMLDGTVPILSAPDLMVFSMLFDRRTDWADIEAMLRHATVDVDEARHWLTQIVGAEDPRHLTLNALLAEVES